MAREPWLIDSRRFATKIKNPNFDPSEEFDSSQEDRKTGVTKECPKCSHKLSNRDIAKKWPGLPAGVKFDPSDQELLGHLAAKVGVGNLKPHAFINEFIPTLEEEDGICYTHPEKLPGVKQDGRNAHFFHRTANAYLRGNRKRRKINSGDNQNGVVLDCQKTGKIRWHKTGKTRPVENEGLRGWKKIMVLYMSNGKGEKDEKTNWVMHQYHLGTGEDEKDGEFVVSKVSYQQQSKNCDKNPTEEVGGTLVGIGDPVTPKTSTPELPRPGKWRADLDTVQEENFNYMDIPANRGKVTDLEAATHQANAIEDMPWSGLNDEADEKFDDLPWDALNDPASSSFDSAWLTGDSQLRTDSQQPLDDLLTCNENLPSSSPKEKSGNEELVSGLAEHGRIEENGNTSGDTSCLDDIELDTPPEVQTFDSQFNSQESLTAWTKGI